MSKLKNCIICFNGSFNDGFPHSQNEVRRWTENNSGVFQTKMDADTTHLVVSKEKWRGKSQLVVAALARDNVYVVSYDWFESTIKLGKRTVGPYLWTKLDDKAKKKEAQKLAREAKEKERARKAALKAAEKQKKDAGKISYARALTDHTDAFMNPEERLAYSQSVALRASNATSSGRAPGQQAPKALRKADQKARSDLFSDNHHVFIDTTGFHYDIVLVKIDVSTNVNERIMLTMYESNSHPRTYATTSHLSGTRIPLTRDTPAIIGSNYATAFRYFKREFQRRTGVEWDGRIAHYEGLARDRVASGSANRRMRSKEERKRDQKRGQKMEDMLFVYRLPAAGMARGVVPEPQRRQRQATQATLIFGGEESVDDGYDGGCMMSGAIVDDEKSRTDGGDGAAAGHSQGQQSHLAQQGSAEQILQTGLEEHRQQQQQEEEEAARETLDHEALPSVVLQRSPFQPEHYDCRDSGFEQPETQHLSEGDLHCTSDFMIVDPIGDVYSTAGYSHLPYQLPLLVAGDNVGDGAGGAVDAADDGNMGGMARRIDSTGEAVHATEDESIGGMVEEGNGAGVAIYAIEDEKNVTEMVEENNNAGGAMYAIEDGNMTDMAKENYVSSAGPATLQSPVHLVDPGSFAAQNGGSIFGGGHGMWNSAGIGNRVGVHVPAPDEGHLIGLGSEKTGMTAEGGDKM